jgi:flagellar motor switch/type III secretory pathway protein FliN
MTSSTAPVEGLTKLKKIDPQTADITNMIMRLIEGERFADETGIITLSSQVERGGWGANPVFKTQTGLMFQIVELQSKPFIITADRIREAAAAVDQIGPVLDHIETVLGIPLEPIDLITPPDASSVLIRVTAKSDDGPSDQIIIAGDVGSFNPTHMAAASRVCTAHPKDVPVVFEILVTAATLPIEEAAELADGDMILIGRQAPAKLRWESPSIGGPEKPIVDGYVDFSTGLFILQMEKDDAMASEPQGFGVPVTISLPTRTTSAESLAALKPGVTLPLGPITAGLRVDILVGGRTLAQGEIVQVGDQFAVLIEDRASMDDAITADQGSDVPQEDAPPSSVEPVIPEDED